MINNNDFESFDVIDELDFLLDQANEEYKKEKTFNSKNQEDEIWQKASLLNLPASLLIAREDLSLNLSEKRWWLAPHSTNEKSSFVKDLNLFGQTNSPVVDMAKAIAASVQFPENTSYMHALGVIASLAVRNFKICYWSINNHIPCNLYVVTSQPPSTGKSSINSGLTSYARELISEKNKENRPLASLLRVKIDKKQKEAEKIENQHELEHVISEIKKLEDQYSLVSEYRYGFNDITPEAAEEKASSQGGVITIVSAESYGVKTVLGDLYQNGTPNQNFFLCGWDGEPVSSARITRTGYNGNAYISIAVLAQDKTFDSILASAGKDSGGVSERFLMVREPSMMGNRKSKDRIPVPFSVEQEYNQLIKNILNEKQIYLTVQDKALKEIEKIKDWYDDQCKIGGKYSSDMMMGIVGKADKQIHKIAAILHIAKAWSSKGDKSTEINVIEVMQAFLIFKDCVKIYEAIADNRGVEGENTNIIAATEQIKKIINSNQPKFSIKLSNLRDRIKNLKEFKRENFTHFLKVKLIPQLEDMHYIAYNKTTDIIHINPILKD